MMRLSIVCFFLLLMFAVFGAKKSSKRAVPAGPRLYKKLTKRLANWGQPAMPPSVEQVNVRFGVTFNEVLKMDVEPRSSTGVLDANAWLQLDWDDMLTKWDPRKFGGIESVRLPMDLIWIPDIKLYNSRVPELEWDKRSMVVVYSSGSLNLVVPSKLQTTCHGQCPAGTSGGTCQGQMDMNNLSCRWKFGSWTYDASRLNVTLQPTPMEMRSFDDKGDWAVSNVTATRNQFVYPCCANPYVDVTYTFTLSRRY